MDIPWMIWTPNLKKQFTAVNQIHAFYQSILLTQNDITKASKTYVEMINTPVGGLFGLEWFTGDTGQTEMTYEEPPIFKDPLIPQ